MSKKVLLLGAFALLVSVLVGCGTAAGPGGSATGDVALRITGSVDNEMGWTEAEIRAMDAIEATYVNKQGETETHTGVPINTLLELAGVKEGATTVVYVADDDYTADVALADVQGCADCIVAFRDEGGFGIVMPDFSSKLQVKGVIEIQVN